jgi:hypothetical protein
MIQNLDRDQVQQLYHPCREPVGHVLHHGRQQERRILEQRGKEGG